MAASDVQNLQLPLNFGLADLYEENNNNAAFIFANKKRFGASSLMLGFHSPVIKEKYIKEGILEIEADEFSYDAIKTFVEGMYCGHLNIVKENFREINKMSHVFQVTWMSSRCLDYFEGVFDEFADSDEELKKLFDEAAYFNEHAQSGSLLDIWKEKTGEKRCHVFIREYLETFTDLSNSALDTIISLTYDHSVFLGFISERISKTNSVLDGISRYLLLNTDLVGSFDYHAERITDIFDTLLDNEQSPDWGMLNSLYRKVSKESLLNQSKEIRAILETKAVSFSNLFHNDWHVEIGDDIESTLDSVADLSCNLHMVLEYMNKWQHEVTGSVICKIQKLRKRRGWSPVHPDFVDRLHNMSAESKQLLKDSSEITSDEHDAVIISEEQTDMWDLLNVSKSYEFNLLRQEQYSCEAEESECGILVEVTEVPREIPGRFDIKLILDEKKYPDDLHCHEISADKLHLAVEYEHNVGWFNKCVSWRGRPNREGGRLGRVWWGRQEVTPSYTGPVRLVIYLLPGWRTPDYVTCKRRKLS